MASSNIKMQKAQHVLHYLTPAIILLYYLGALGVVICTLQKGRKPKRNISRQTTSWILGYIVASYLAQSGVLLADSISATPRFSSSAANINALSNTLLWSALNACLYRAKRPVWHPYVGAWLIALVLEITTFSLSISHHAVSDAGEYVLVAIQTSRFAAFTVLLVAHATARIRPKWLQLDEESTSLLQPHNLPSKDSTMNGSAKAGYGSVAVTPTGDASTDEEDSESDDSIHPGVKKKKKALDARLQNDGSWFTYLRGFAIFVPMIWPFNRPRLYFNMMGCMVCILAGRVLGVLKPRQLGIIISILTSGSGSLYTAVGLYVLFVWASGSSGIGLVQRSLWLPVEQYSEMTITTAAYNQIMELSGEFHDNKQSGELYQSIKQGSSITELLDLFIFSLGPRTLDLFVGYGYLYYLFGPYMALIAAATSLWYMATITYFNGKQSGYRRKCQALEREASQVMYDTMGSWTTVSYFNRIPYEEDRYKKSRISYITAQRLWFILGNLYYSISGCAVDVGLWGALILAAYQVSNGIKPVGDFVILLNYWSFFQGPLGIFAYGQRRILQCLIDAEQLLSLFQLKSKIKDGSKKLLIKGGKVEFENVKFSYDGSKSVINGVSFVAQPGQKIALVGETGGGKSTLLKLLFRFYDVAEGSVLIDGQDVRDVTIDSLRAGIGVVPQDPSMFNKTVMENVRYSKLDATDEEVMEACKAAAVHDKILSFTNGYASKVGEKGVMLSGGELQRLAIARAILKDPEIILLDEATSSVDTETESRIQNALQNLSRGRTTFTVAHRLSTVVDSDIILVIKDGMILEQGSPRELLATKGKYYDLWCKQVGIVSKDTTTKADNAVANSINNNQLSLLDLGFKMSHGNGANGSLGDKPANAEKDEHGKVWRPDAPEFIPRHLRGRRLSKVQSDQQNTKDSGNTHAEPSKQQQAKGKSTGKVKSQGKRQRASDQAMDSATGPSTSGAASAIGTPKLIDIEGTENDEESDRKRARLNKVRRRKMSKSEPTDASTSMGDGAFDEDHTLEVSHDGATNQKRHVSAPMKESSAANDKSSGQGRRGGRKHWRARGGNSSHTQSDRSRQTSGTLSAVSGTATPFEPTTTPEKSGKDDAKVVGNGKGAIRFA
ncbi:MAG: hypothetical protein Q9218_003879 [Villophora microphyllina]